MGHYPVGRGATRLLTFVAALGLSSLGCEDDSPGVNADAGGGNGGGDSASLEASSSMGGAGGSGGSGGAGGNGGAGGTAGSAAGGSTSTSAGPAAGGSGGTDAESDGSGGSAGGPGASCADPDPRCASLGASSTCVGYLSTKCEDTNADGCLEFLQENCAPGACQDGECVPGGASEACGDATNVVGSGFTLEGVDFGADFSHDLEVTGADCELPDVGVTDAVFQVALEAGQTLSVVERGGLDALVHVQAACGADQACLASSDDVEQEPLSYVAATDETVNVVVEAYFSDPNPAWYRLRIDIDATCGNGLLEASEDCDVGDPAVSAGCSEECLVEFGYVCDETSPSLCAPLESLGEFDWTDSIDPIVASDKFEVWDEHRWLVTFTETVVLELAATTRTSGTGDVQIEILNEAGRVVAYRLTGDEVDHEPLGLPAGSYLIRVYAETPLPEGYRIDFDLNDPGECGDGVVEPALEECDTAGAPGCTEACDVDFDYLCEGHMPTVCEPIESLGSFGADETLPLVETDDAIVAGDNEYWVFSLSEDVRLSGAVTVNGTGEASVFIYSSAGGYPWGFETEGVDEPFALDLVAGHYKIEVHAQNEMPAGYQLTFETEAL